MQNESSVERFIANVTTANIIQIQYHSKLQSNKHLHYKITTLNSSYVKGKNTHVPEAPVGYRLPEYPD